ncbi:MAG: hypothetical protein Q9184_001773 [Pyrenodesmia sp. 2 TL-2023]
MTSPPPPLTIALSGLSSTGKSTIASHLPSIFPPPHYALTLLHVDEFYKSQAELPFRDGLLDWDCTASLDWPRLEAAVRRWKDGEQVEEGKVNPQPTIAVGEGGGITQALVEELRDEVGKMSDDIKREEGTTQRILLLDGFLLFAPSVPRSFVSLLDVKILLRAPYEEAKRRREARSGYSTMEGWWEDPPGYFDRVVWPNYVQENRGFFGEGDVEGAVDEGVCKREGVRVRMGREGKLKEVLRWLVGVAREGVDGGDGEEALTESGMRKGDESETGLS